MKDLIDASFALPSPQDYFRGFGDDPWCWPRNVIAFVRGNRKALQQRSLESRMHARHVLVICLQTGGVVNVDGAPYPLLPGQAHLIFPFQFHTYHDLVREQLCWLFLTFELPEDQRLHSLRHASVTLDDDMRQRLQRFLTGYNSAMSPALQQRLQLELATLLASLATISARAPTPQGQSKHIGAAALLGRIRDHLTHALPDALSISDLSVRIGLSEGRLRAVFRESFGISLGHYLRSFYLHEALAMMHHSSATLTEVAHSCGFSSSAAFSRAFKAWTGLTPRKFRARN